MTTSAEERAKQVFQGGIPWIRDGNRSQPDWDALEALAARAIQEATDEARNDALDEAIALHDTLESDDGDPTYGSGQEAGYVEYQAALRILKSNP